MTDLQIFFDKAEHATEKNNLEEALMIYDKILSFQPDNILALLGSALLQERRSFFIEAAFYYRRITKLTPESIESRFRYIYERSCKYYQIYHLAGIVLMQQCRFVEALEFFNFTLHQFQSHTGRLHRPTLYYTGLCYLHQNDALTARKMFNAILREMPTHVDAWFNLGNAEQMIGNNVAAVHCYEQAIMMDPSFAEAYFNASLIIRATNMNRADIFLFKAIQLKPHLQLPGSGICNETSRLKGRYWKECRVPENFKNIPVFINCRDKVTPLKQLVQWLLEAGYANITLLDNDSTFPRLLQYYQEIIAEQKNIRVVMLKQNLGHQALWRSNILSQTGIEAPFVYTDSDIVPIKECPDDVLEVFWRILVRNPFVQKVGFGLKIDDIPNENTKKREIQNNEAPYWMYQVPEEKVPQYLAPIDTTFAMYRHGKYYETPHSIRTGHPYLARHTDWYLDTERLDEETAYYFAHADLNSASTKQAWNL